MFKALALAIILLRINASVFAQYPPVEDYGPVASFGHGLTRTLDLLRSSTESQRKRVRVLFYGQSITEQTWSASLAAELRRRFPNADLEITNRAIPGFLSHSLVKSAETDLYSFYPDLLIFQVYGSAARYEDIIRRVRSRTTADIILQTEHPLVPADLSEPTEPAYLSDSTSTAWHNYIFLPALADKYDCELADIRTPWKRYLSANELEPSALLWDTIHLNVHGNYVMKELVGAHLLKAGPHTLEASSENSVRTLKIGTDIAFTNGALNLEFVGNRIEAIAAMDAAAPVSVLIDGVPPSSIPELYTFTRASLYPGTVWPVFIGIESQRPLIEEEWTATITSYTNLPYPQVEFTVSGSKTGFDGSGRSTAPFVSNSGLVVIDPADWMLYMGGPGNPLSVGFQVKWTSVRNGTDSFLPKSTPPGYESSTVLASGLANGPHRLTLRTTHEASLAAIRIYNPLARKQAEPPPPLRITSFTKHGSTEIKFTVHNSIDRHVIEQALDAAGPWHSFSAPMYSTDSTFTGSSDRAFYRAKRVE